MDLNQSTSVELLLVDRVEKQLRGAGAPTPDRAILLEALNRVLYDVHLAPEEQAALIPIADRSPDRVDAIDRFLAVRVERALQATLDAASRSTGGATVLRAPKVLVHRSKPPSPREKELEDRSTLRREIPGALPSPATLKLDELGREGRGVLVLADGPAVYGLLDRHVNLRIGDHGLGLHFRAGEGDDLLTLGASDPGAVHVLEFEFALAHLENILEQAVAGRLEAGGGAVAGALPDPAVPAQAGTPDSSARLLASSADHPPIEPDPSDPMIGTLFDGKYLILRRIGKGGFGVVYEARDVRLDHRIAIKLLHPGATRTPQELQAFKSEARRATRLSHPNIVDWKTFEQSRDGAWYFVMELLEGEELEAVMKELGPMDARRTGRILLQVLDALRAAHDVGSGQSVLHLDLKPKNVFLLPAHPGESAERVKVIDFGIGQFIGAEESSGTTPTAAALGEAPIDAGRVADGGDTWNGVDSGEGRQTLLSVHTFREDGSRSTLDSSGVQRSTACTPEYAAPEQCAHLLPEVDALPLDGRADLYALGVIGFQMLTGKLPFEKPARRKDLLHIKQTIEPRKVGSIGVRVPKDLAQFIDRCLARHRDGRYRDANEAYEVLRRIVHPPLRKSFLWGGGVLVLAAVAAAWIAGKRLGHQGIDLYRKVDGEVERSLANSRLYLGPARDHESIRVSGLDSPSELEGIRMVDSRDMHANEITGFHALPQSDGQVIITADASPGRIQRPAYLEVQSFARNPAWSAPFELVWIGTDAWDLESISIENLGERSVDPTGASLAINVRGASEDLSSVSVQSGGHTYGARWDVTRSRGSEGVYRVPLEELNLDGDRAELRVHVTDMAGRTQDGTFGTNLATGPLALLEASLDSTAVGGRYSLSPRGDPQLKVRTSRKADLAYVVRDDNGGMLMKGSVQGVENGQYPLTGLTQLRGGKSFSGSIEVVADESAYVLHAGAGDRGVVHSRLDFIFADTAPDYSVRVATPGGGLGKSLDASHPVFVSKHQIVVRVGRENPLPLRVQVVCAPTDHPESAQELAPQFMVDREAISADFPVETPSDGEYALTVRVWRHDQPGEDAGHAPDSVLIGSVVVDSSPAVLSVSGPAEGIVLRSKTDPLPKVEVSVLAKEGPAALMRTPVDLHWDLVLAQRPGESIASGPLGSAIPGEPPKALEIPAPWGAETKQVLTPDGNYRLVVSGVDAAGNTAVSAGLSFDTAIDGPELELSRPPPKIHWPRGESGGFDIQVVARDPNGVAEVHGLVRRAGGADVPFDLQATGDPRHADISVWTGTVPFDESWSNRSVEVHLISVDGFGTSSKPFSEPRELGPVEHLLPPRVAVEFGTVPVEVLRLVDGNAAAAYTFGGRVDPEEEHVHAAAGLPPYNSLNTPRSWRVSFAPHEIPSFYLDEHEVSVGQYLAFVRASNGYGSASTWPEGSSPDASRRESLERDLAAAPADMPVADLSWEEAFAYARWVGKRLPSLVEWEFAVRGGTLYRPFASAKKNPRMPTREEVNYDPDGAGDGSPWPCAQGGDVTEDTGIYDLGGNVAEWTATPASFLDGAVTPLNVPAHALENRALFLDPRRFGRSEKMERYWVAGGSFQSARADFLTIDRRGRAWHDPTVGFRCAADADSAAAAPTPSSADRPRFRGLFE